MSQNGVEALSKLHPERTFYFTYLEVPWELWFVLSSLTSGAHLVKTAFPKEVFVKNNQVTSWHHLCWGDDSHWQKQVNQEILKKNLGKNVTKKSGQIGTLTRYWWKCKLVGPLWKAIGQLLKWSTSNSTPVHTPKRVKTHVHTKLCMDANNNQKVKNKTKQNFHLLVNI